MKIHMYISTLIHLSFSGDCVCGGGGGTVCMLKITTLENFDVMLLVLIMMITETSLKTLFFYGHLMRLIAREFDIMSCNSQVAKADHLVT
jgi:hypothetical protein